MTNDRCAIFMMADPFMKKDLETIRSILKLYSGVDIILDRRWQSNKYLMSFNDRKEIVDREMSIAGITNYTIIPNDTSRYDTALKNGVKNIAVELNNNTNVSYLCEKFNMAKKIIPELSMIVIPQFSDCLVKSYSYLYELILEDITHQQHRKYVSDYAYMKTKFSLMHKICLTGNLGCDFKTIMDTFRERGYEVLDVGEMISNAFLNEKVIEGAFRDCEDTGIDTTDLSATRDGKLIAIEENVLLRCMHDPVSYDIWS